MLKDSSSSYGLITILLHWVCALLIFSVFGLGVYMVDLDYYSPWYHRAPEIHIEMGLTIFFLMCLRLFWRTRNSPPTPIPSIGKTTLLAASAVKILLYFAIFIICFSGYLITTAEGQGANFFDIFSVPASVQLSAHNVDRAGAIHKYLAWGVIVLAIAHSLAALFHHFVKRDKTLIRMLNPANKAD